MLKTFFIIFFVFLFTYKSSSEIITGIKVVNNHRISKETILIFSDIEIGKDYSANDLNKIIQDLYSTNFFSNILLDVTDGILIIDIQENKIIQQITINGIKKNELVEVLKKQLLSKDKNPFVENHVRFDVNRIKKILENSGYYFSDVTSKIIENDNSTVELVFDITIGEKAFIRNIQFIGDKYYKDRVLRNIIASEEARFWKFLSKKKYINPELIELDKRLLKNHYLNKGHYHVIVNDSFIEYTDNNDFKLVYNIEAGPKFTVDKTSL
ncbi:MAG: outer membrane protein assembly factor BamA, partial [Pelagibacterales bacterium]|nr:outer membrane protein assembly factor BamA [Pelagibacterales bacterium]